MTGQAIYLVGGDEFSPATALADERVLGMLRRKRVAVVPTAAADQRPELAGENGVRHFSALGADASIVMILDKADAGNGEFCERLMESDLIYLTGGSPAHLVEVRRLEMGMAVVAGISPALIIGHAENHVRRGAGRNGDRQRGKAGGCADHALPFPEVHDWSHSERSMSDDTN